ncbi:sel1 repeat family protein [Oxalobacter vibrioformis]|uniref:Sel1 repeat family protein n=1 Tax=Oxalobacter vibrioformis TaxID=933080 RepID=A0A9E9P3C9_9BURK|nr:tetratricopeptide repeat protein [Oxalobacter vibrioformis]WAW09868.1 sel1 repeat family protein [Oxalobacter vibrioformis]
MFPLINFFDEKGMGMMKKGMGKKGLLAALLAVGCFAATGMVTAQDVGDKGEADTPKRVRMQRGDNAEVIATLRQKAQSGDDKAQARLGIMYEQGLGVRRDGKQAVAWYEKAAAQNNSFAQTALADMYARGREVSAIM